MKVGVIGSGDVGQTLANGFIKHGHDVMIGTNNQSKMADLKTNTGGKAKIGSFAETAQFGELLVLAVKGAAAESALKSIGAAVDGKVVIDTTNPIAEEAPVNGVLKFFTDLNSSLMERLQKAAPKAKFVKAFSCVGSDLMVNPNLPGGKPTMFICGNDTGAKKEVSKILDTFGFDVDDMGSAEAARGIEPLCILWCIPGFIKNDWTHAFKMLRA